MKKFKHEALGEPESKPRVNSKAKGGINERKVAKILSDWTGAKFIRVPMSGGLHYEYHLLCGDLVCVTADFEFVFAVETKHYKTVKLKDSAWMRKVIHQATEDAKRAKKYPLIMLRENGMPRGEYYVLLNVAKDRILSKSRNIFEIQDFYTVMASDLFTRHEYEDIYKYLTHGE